MLKKVLVLFVALSMMALLPQHTMAKRPDPSPKEIIILLEKDPKSVTKSDLILLTHTIFQEKITTDQLFDFYNTLSLKQQEFVRSTFLAIASEYVGPYVEPKTTPETPSVETPNAILACDPGAAPYCWKQFIQEDNNNPMNKIGPVNYYTNQFSCDPDADVDYIFYFAFNASNPDAIRFTATGSVQVAAALSFEGLIGGNGEGLSGYGYNNNEVRFCVGNKTVWSAGGTGNVMSYLKLYNR